MSCVLRILASQYMFQSTYYEIPILLDSESSNLFLFDFGNCLRKRYYKNTIIKNVNVKNVIVKNDIVENAIANTTIISKL